MTNRDRVRMRVVGRLVGQDRQRRIEVGAPGPASGLEKFVGGQSRSGSAQLRETGTGASPPGTRYTTPQRSRIAECHSRVS